MNSELLDYITRWVDSEIKRGRIRPDEREGRISYYYGLNFEELQDDGRQISEHLWQVD